MPILLKPYVPKPVAKAPAPKRVVAKAPASRNGKAFATVRAVTVAQPVVTRPARSKPAVIVADVRQAEAAPVAPMQRPTPPAMDQTKQSALPVMPPQDEAEPEAMEVASASPEEAATTPEANNDVPMAEEDVIMPPPDQQVAALEAPVQTRTPPPTATEPPIQTKVARAGDEISKQVRTVPLSQSPEPSPPAAIKSSAPDWGDEKKLVEALRNDWKGKPVMRTFLRGEEVPSDIPLQQLPPPFANQATGVTMNYLIANGDAVLVLPGMRVVVDVYHSSTASLPDR